VDVLLDLVSVSLDIRPSPDEIHRAWILQQMAQLALVDGL